MADLIVWLMLTAVSVRVVPMLLDYVTRLKVGDGHLIEAFSILVCFSYAAFSGTLGLSPFVGAFIAGMAIADSLYLDLIKDFVENVEVIFVPLFFVVMGASVDPSSILHTNFLLILILCLVGVASKLIGCGLRAAGCLPAQGSYMRYTDRVRHDLPGRDRLGHRKHEIGRASCRERV